MLKATTGIPSTVYREWRRRSSVKQRYYSFIRNINFPPFFKSVPVALIDDLSSRRLIRWQSTISSSSSSEASSDAAATIESGKKKNRRVALAVYRQLLRLTSQSSPYQEIPLSSFVHPIRIEAPESIDATRLQALAQIIKTGPNDIVQRIRNMLPAQTEIQETHIRVPIHRLADLEQLVRAVFRINSETPSTHDYDKKRMSAAFKGVRYLNEMKSDLQHIQESRLDHQNRENVKFHIGQVVRHREDRWRGVIADWSRGSNKNKTVVAAAAPPHGKTSLTTKSYKRALLEFPSPANDDSKDDDINKEKEDNKNDETTIEYSVILHEGDAHNLGSMLGTTPTMIEISQSELELVDNENLLRIRSPVMDEYFTRFNASTGAFSPDEFQAYKYPCDDTVFFELKHHTNNNDILEPSAQKLCDDIVSAVQEFAAKRLLKLCLHLQHSLDALKVDSPLLATVYERVDALAHGKISMSSYNRQDSGADASSQTVSSLSTTRTAVLHLHELLHLQHQIYNLNAQRKQCKEHGNRMRYCLGEIVRHKAYGYRGVVVGWDVTPTVDVRNWDGLQHIENPMELPFYYIVPDTNDCIQAFKGPRPLRYVCQENLEACPENQKFIQVDIEMLNPNEWHRKAVVLRATADSDTSSASSYNAPFEARYEFGEDLQDDGLTEDCLSQIEDELNRWHVLARRGEIKVNDNANTDEDLYKIENEEDAAMLAKLSIQKLQSLLQLVDNEKDAVVLQNLLKEMRRAHVDPYARQELERGVAELTSGQAKKASETFHRLVTDVDPSYAEGWNTLATCEFLMARYEAAMQAASQALALDPNNVPARTGLGLIYMELKEYEIAAYHFEKTMTIDPWSPGEFQYCPHCVHNAHSSMDELESLFQTRHDDRYYQRYCESQSKRHSQLKKLVLEYNELVDHWLDDFKKVCLQVLD